MWAVQTPEIWWPIEQRHLSAGNANDQPKSFSIPWVIWILPEKIVFRFSEFPKNHQNSIDRCARIIISWPTDRYRRLAIKTNNPFFLRSESIGLINIHARQCWDDKNVLINIDIQHASQTSVCQSGWVVDPEIASCKQTEWKSSWLLHKPINEFHIKRLLQGCVDKLIEIIYENWVTIFAVTAAVILLELLSLTFALSLCCAVRNQHYKAWELQNSHREITDDEKY